MQKSPTRSSPSDQSEPLTDRKKVTGTMDLKSSVPWCSREELVFSLYETPSPGFYSVSEVDQTLSPAPLPLQRKIQRLSFVEFTRPTGDFRFGACVLQTDEPEEELVHLAVARADSPLPIFSDRANYERIYRSKFGNFPSSDLFVPFEGFSEKE